MMKPVETKLKQDPIQQHLKLEMEKRPSHKKY